MSRLIDADEAIDYVNNLITVHRYYHPRSTTENFPISEVIARINEVPTVDATPVRHGHWKGKPLAGYSTVKCSVCGSAFMENSGKWKYCPDCGAKMDDSTQSNDSNTLDALGRR